MLRAIINTIGPIDTWLPYPGGYPNEVEAALLDSVFSLRAVYGSAGAGPRAVVDRWRQHVERRQLNSLSALVADVDSAGGPEAFPAILKHYGIAVPNAKDKPTKAGAVYGIARTLVTFGVDTTEDLKLKSSGSPRDLHRVLTKERGFGDAGATYFLMLVGIPGVKADVMIQRFVSQALDDDRIEPARCQKLVADAAEELGADLLRLDHAIWSYESRRARSNRALGRSAAASTP